MSLAMRTCLAAVVLMATAAWIRISSSAATGRDAPPPIGWLHDEGAASARSRETGKPLLIDFRADWCSACKMLDRFTWSDPTVRAEVADRFVPLQIDLGAEDAAASERMTRYGVAGLPTVLAGATRITGFVRPREMLAALRGGRH